MTEPVPFFISIFRTGPDTWTARRTRPDGQIDDSALMALDERSAQAEAAERFGVFILSVAVLREPAGKSEPNV